jgi:hypothetical protein
MPFGNVVAAPAERLRAIGWKQNAYYGSQLFKVAREASFEHSAVLFFMAASFHAARMIKRM